MKPTPINLIFSLFALVLHSTYRYRFFNVQHRQAAERGHPLRVIAFGLWHQNSFVGTLAHHHQSISPLCSLSRDGQMVAFLCRRIGLRPILGSSSRGGKSAREALLSGVEHGLSPALTVDGPKGPPYKSKNGIIDLAKKAQVQVLPMTAVGERYWQLRSWDKLRIPKPFSRVAVCYGEPIKVPADAQDESFEACRALLDQRLEALEGDGVTALANWAGVSARELKGVLSGG